MAEFAKNWVYEFWFILEMSGIWLLVGFSLAGVMHALMPVGVIQKHLSGRGIWPIFRASLLGIPLPLCSCSVIPVAAGLRRAGAGRGASAAFAISTPQTGEESIPLTWALFGPVFAIARPIVAVLTALIAGVLVERFGGEHEVMGEAPKGCCGGPTGETPVPQEEKGCCGGPTGETPVPHEEKGCCGGSTGGMPVPQEEKGCCGGPTGGTPVPQEEKGLMAKFGDAFKHGFVTMPLDLAPWLGVGLVLAAGVSAAVPQGWIAENVGTGIVPMLLMVLVGVPLYICATSSTPLAFTLVAAGLSPGAALVLLLVGPATNIATISWSIKDLGIRATVICMVVVSAVAVGFGLAFDVFFSGMVALADGAGVLEHGHSGLMAELMAGGGVSLLLMLVVSLFVRGWRRIVPMKISTHG